jgi:hypothetical protein
MTPTFLYTRQNPSLRQNTRSRATFQWSKKHPEDKDIVLDKIKPSKAA